MFWGPHCKVLCLKCNGLALLQVEAEASTDSQPLPGFTPRKGAGLPFLGKSVTYPPARRVRRHAPPAPVPGIGKLIVPPDCQALLVSVWVSLF